MTIKHVAFAALAGCSTTTMPTPEVALMVRIEAKPEHAATVAKLLADGRAFVMDEPGTPYWFAVRLGETSFGIFDAFPSDAERTTHLQGKLASALLASAPDLLSTAPVIQPVEIIGSKYVPSQPLTVGLVVRIDAKPEHSKAVGDLLASGVDVVAEEAGTPLWFGVRIDDNAYAIFDAFPTNADRDAHLGGKLAAALLAKADEYLAKAPSIEKADVIASKLP